MLRADDLERMKFREGAACVQSQACGWSHVVILGEVDVTIICSDLICACSVPEHMPVCMSRDCSLALASTARGPTSH
eukprot:6469312-Amphidinium_carterae.1